MTDNPMWIVAAGGALTGTAVLLFLYSLWLGLNRQRWWPCGLVCGIWLIAMAAYAAWDASARDDLRRRPVDARNEPVTSLAIEPPNAVFSSLPGLQPAPAR